MMLSKYDMREGKIIDILDKHGIAWSGMGDVIFVGKDRVHKIKKIRKELLKVKNVKQGYTDEGDYIAFDKDKLKKVV